MKIKNLKYIIFALIGIYFFSFGKVLGECSSDMSTGSRTYPGNGQSSGNCRSIATQGDNRYNNSQDLAGADLFLKLINVSWSSCNASTVGNIQTKMQQIGGNCSTCIDGRAGNKMRNSINNCVSKMCTGDLVTPVLNGGVLSCSLPDYSLIDHTAFGMTYKCCQEDEVVENIVSGTPNITKNSRQNNILEVNIYFPIDNPDWIVGEDTTKISINGGILSTATRNLSTVVATINTNTNNVTVNVGEGLLLLDGGGLSLPGSQTFTKDESECPDSPENGSCGEGCAIAGNSCAPAITTCGDNQVAPGGGVCTGCTEGTIPNEQKTKCICDSSTACCGIQLNTVVPFIGDCIEMNTDSSRGDTTSVNSVTAFPILMQGLMKIVMSVIMVFSFIMVIVSGFMMTTGAFSSTNFDKGKTILKNVLISLILLGCSGLILTLINPSFFGG